MFFTVSSAACVSDSDDATEWREVVDALPSGVPISVEITTPADSTVLAPGPVQVTGFATIGETAPIAETTLAYVVDVSGSTLGGGGCGGDLNGDDLVDTVLDCEIAALIELNKLAAANGTIADVGAAVFGTFGATADVQPGGTDNDLLTEPDADLDMDMDIDIDEVLRSLKTGLVGEFTDHVVGGGTSYGAGLSAIEPALSASTQANKVVIFVSDGNNNLSPHINQVLPTLPADAVVHTFAIGASSTCDPVVVLGTLQDISDATGGSCTEVPDVTELPDIIPSVVAAELISLELTVDGKPEPIDSIVPALPQEGPAMLAYSTLVEGLTPGVHVLCATAAGVDVIAKGDVTECSMIRVTRAPPPM
ncbi:vWA domain-containing protein [Enhygromyxa salina]|uniref:vWA domain-containing protein n=1 Tax=Enhygromyxa salina TaxID=215803 RepID=UPI0011B1FBB7|nr:hypothetical protein [Enhygromyxa salina]